MVESLLRVKEIFKSIQGEGPHAGRPAIFIRLAECNLSCSFCDTEHTAEFGMTVSEIMKDISVNHCPLPELIVITGGEPLMQDIGDLVNAFLSFEVEVQLETNGTLPMSQRLIDVIEGEGVLVWNRIDIVVSPKKNQPVHASIAHRAKYWKYLIDARDRFADDGLPLNHSRPEQFGIDHVFFLQPIDAHDEAENHFNKKKAAALCIEHGHRLSLQMHKIVGIE